MPKPVSPDPQSSTESSDPAERSETVEWSEMFIKHLQLEFYDTVVERGVGISEDEYRQWMTRAFLTTLAGTGLSSEDISQLFREQLTLSVPIPKEPWNDAKNERRVVLIDKSLQGQLTVSEKAELATLTQQLRHTFDDDAFVPLNAAKQLHRQLLNLENERRETH